MQVFKYCSQCGGKTHMAVPKGDNKVRAICQSCHHIFYDNPRIVAGTLPVYKDKVLLCKRAIEPRKGYWTLPAGFMENGESTEQAALRETYEEAHAHVVLESLYASTSILHVNQVQLIYLATLSRPEFGPGSESLEVALFDEAEIPWQDLAFTTITSALKQYFADRKQGQGFALRHFELAGNQSLPQRVDISEQAFIPEAD
ncbi:MAG: NUDIX hydrolase [Pontibacterium sp.]